MSPSSKIILDLCGGTGSWSKPYKEAGYDVRIITLPEYDIHMTKKIPHPVGRLLQFLGPELNLLNVWAKDVYGILAAPPPCTEFSLAKGNRPRNLEAAMETVRVCLEIIWYCRFTENLKFWAMENPVGLLRQFLGKPAYTFEQWQFKDDGIKPTDLWGYFREPTPTVQERPEHLVLKYKDQHSHGRRMAVPKCPEEYRHMNLTRAEIRAITPVGFARAFFKANQ